MRQVSSLVSTYSSDEFGICSALYELGGMVVMHDASGCNSTYTTHDEPRWYDIDSMIYISAISEMEAIMGDDGKFIEDLEATAKMLHPNFIAIVGAPIPYMIGTDFQSIAAITEKRTGIPCFGFEANGMHWYTKGVSMALEKIVEHYCVDCVKKREPEKLRVNLIGATPLDFCVNGSIQSIKAWSEDCGMEVQCCLAYGSTLEELKTAGSADASLVLSYGGLAAAKLLKQRFGIPYVVGVPFGDENKKALKVVLETAVDDGLCKVFYKNEQEVDSGKKKIGIIGEVVYSSSLAKALENRFHNLSFQVLCPLDAEAELLRNGDLLTPEEDDVIQSIKEVEGVIADPLYEPLILRFAPEVKFYPLPHEAFSGRIYDPVNPNLVDGFEEWVTVQDF